MPVKEADPRARELEEAFAEAMAAPPVPKEPPPPADVDPAAPFGRDADGTPRAPHGLTKDGKIRRSPAGRKPKDDQPRTAPPGTHTAGQGPGAAPGHADTPGPVPTRDYSGPLAEFADAVWFAASALGKGGSAIPLIGRYVPERKMAAQALVFRSFKPNLVQAVNIAAQHNRRAARFAAAIETGGITWVMVCGFLVMPFVTTSAAIWKGAEALDKAGLLELEKLAAENDKQLDAYLASVGEQLQAAVDAQAAEALQAMNGQAAAPAAADVQEAQL